jgi:hypothetical protein
MPCQFAYCINRVCVIHEDKPAYDGVKWLFEAQLGWVAFHEPCIADVSRLSLRSRPAHGFGGAIDSDDLTARSDQVGG